MAFASPRSPANLTLRQSGAIAQLVERFHGMEEVRSSILLSSTFSLVRGYVTLPGCGRNRPWHFLGILGGYGEHLAGLHCWPDTGTGSWSSRPRSTAEVATRRLASAALPMSVAATSVVSCPRQNPSRSPAFERFLTKPWLMNQAVALRMGHGCTARVMNSRLQRRRLLIVGIRLRWIAVGGRPLVRREADSSQR